ncbi:MAG: diguanylate cyclase domain-containing protein [Isosphaeraceae bacterium]
MPRSRGAGDPTAGQGGTGDLGKWRRVGMALAEAGRRAWDRLFTAAGPYEEGLERFAAEIEISHRHEAIEAALLRLARHIAPSHRIELVRRRGPVGDRAEPGRAVVEFRLWFGTVDHGVLRLHQSEGNPSVRAGARSRRRLAMACKLAACAFERARLQSVWESDGEETFDHLSAVGPLATDRPARSPGLVHDATFLNAVLPFALAQGRRHGEPIALLCIQPDRLGAIRDLLGATVADDLVHDVGETASSVVRASDIVARLDDDRIVVLLMRSLGESAVQVGRKIIEAVGDRGIGHSQLPGTTIAIGVAEFPTIAADAAGLLDAADRAMAQARAGGSRSPVLAAFEANWPCDSPVGLMVGAG